MRVSAFAGSLAGDGAPQERAVGKLVVAVRLERVLEDRGNVQLRLRLLEVVDERRRLADHVRVVVQDVDGRLVRLEGGLRRRAGDGRTLRCGRFRAALRTARPDPRSSAPADAPESSSAPTTRVVTPTIVAPVEPRSVPTTPSSARPTSPPWSAPSASSNPSDRTIRPVRNGLHVDELAARDHQQADDEERCGRDVRGRADRAAQAVLDRTADDTALPAEPEERREEDPDGSEDEAPQLGMVVPALALLAPPLLHPRRNARAQRTLTLLARHGRGFDAARDSPCPEVSRPRGPGGPRARGRAGSP